MGGLRSNLLVRWHCTLISVSDSEETPTFRETERSARITVKENVKKRPFDQVGGLGRQGAVRKRRGDVFEMNGHKFVQRQFYQPILCALCQEFLLTGEGYQCEDCRYACHKKCYPKVVTKCISKSNADTVSRKANRGEQSCAHFATLFSYLVSDETARRRGKDQPPDSSSFPDDYQCQRQLVLSLWIHASSWEEERQEVFRYACSTFSRSLGLAAHLSYYRRLRSYMPCNLRSSCSRLLRYDDGDGQHLAQAAQRYQDHSGPAKACFDHFEARAFAVHLARSASTPAHRRAVPLFARSCGAASARNL